EPPIEAKSGVEDEVIDADLVKAAGLLDDLVGSPGDGRAFDVLGRFKLAGGWLHPPFATLVGPAREPFDAGSGPGFLLGLSNTGWRYHAHCGHGPAVLGDDVPHRLHSLFNRLESDASWNPVVAV